MKKLTFDQLIQLCTKTALVDVDDTFYNIIVKDINTIELHSSNASVHNPDFLVVLREFNSEIELSRNGLFIYYGKDGSKVDDEDEYDHTHFMLYHNIEDFVEDLEEQGM